MAPHRSKDTNFNADEEDGDDGEQGTQKAEAPPFGVFDSNFGCQGLQPPSSPS